MYKAVDVAKTSPIYSNPGFMADFLKVKASEDWEFVSAVELSFALRVVFKRIPE